MTVTLPIKTPPLLSATHLLESISEPEIDDGCNVELSIPLDRGTPRDHIFSAATKLFAEFGYKGSNTRAIAELAGVKQVMVHYYFGSKEHLYEAVLKIEVSNMLAIIFGANLECMSAAETLIDTPIRLMTVLHENPQWASLLRFEIADGAEHLKRALRDVTVETHSGANLNFYDAYSEAILTGTAVELPTEAVRECLLAIGYSVIYLAPLIANISTRDIDCEAVREEWKLTLGTILRHGLLITATPKPLIS